VITKKSVFVLGAGASKPYGFPIGWELVEKVVGQFGKNEPNREILLQHGGFAEDLLDEFLRVLDGSGQNSVDAFLENQPRFLDIGKAAMSIVLISCEKTEQLYRQRDVTQNWLRYLLANMRGSGFDDFHKNAVSFVTFNYDRSLEHFLCRTLADTFSKTDTESGEVIKRIPIVHVHGRLGYLPWQNARGRPFDTAISADVLKMCISEIRVVHEATGPEYEEAKQLLTDAERVYFLGVGYSNTNLGRLGVKTLADNKAASTGVGLVQREFQNISTEYGSKLAVKLHSDCMDFLRNYVDWN
jgi:hypothetical protein